MARAGTFKVHELETAHGLFVFELHLSRRRRSLCIQLSRQPEEMGGLKMRVLAPEVMPWEKVQAFVLRKQRWIKDKSEFLMRQPVPIQRAIKEGETFWWRGQKIPLRILPLDSGRAKISQQENEFVLEVPLDWTDRKIERTGKKLLLEWYRKEATQFLPRRLQALAQTVKLFPDRVSVRTQKTMWGCCHTRKKAIFLNWQLILAPDAVIDYVILHELCHLKVANHSHQFWRMVESLYPDYRIFQIWLKNHQADLLTFLS